MNRKVFLSVFLLVTALLIGIPSACPQAAAPDSEIITPQNVNQVVELGRLGKGEVNQIAFAPDGSWLAAASTIGVYVYDLKSYEESLIPTGQAANCLAVSADGKYLAIGLTKGTLVVVDTLTRQVVRTLAHYTRDPGTKKALTNDFDFMTEIVALAFAPDGSWLASASTASGGAPTVVIWDTQTWMARRILDAGTEKLQYVWYLAMLQDGQQLAAVGYASDGKGVNLAVWEVASGKVVRQVPSVSSTPQPIAASQDGKTLAMAVDQDILLVDAGSGQTRMTLKGHTGNVVGLSFSPDGSRLASSAYDLKYILWDTTSGKPQKETDLKNQWIQGLAFSPGGDALAYFTGGNDIVLVDAVSGDLLKDLNETPPCARGGFCSKFYNAAISPDGSLAATAMYGSGMVWDLEAGKTVSWFRSKSTSFSSDNALEFSPDSRFLAYLNDQNAIVLQEISTRKEISFETIPDKVQVNALTFSRDGTLLAATGLLSDVLVFDTGSGKVLASLSAPEYFFTDGFVGAVFSTDNRYLLAGERGQEMLVWDLSSGQFVENQRNDYMPCIGEYPFFSRDGNTLYSYLTGMPDVGTNLMFACTLKDWNLADGILPLDKEYLLLFHNEDVWDDFNFEYGFGAVSPDGTLLAAGAKNGAVVLFDAKTQANLRVLRGHTDAVRQVGFSADGKRLISASYDGTIRFWGIPAED